MESISLEKFKDQKLSKRKLSFVVGGGNCTGGGFSRFGNVMASWDSDDEDPISGRTTYTNLHFASLEG